MRRSEGEGKHPGAKPPGDQSGEEGGPALAAAASAPRWLEAEAKADPVARALRQALDEAAPGEDEQTFRKQRVWGRVQAPWFDGRGGQPVAVQMGLRRRRAWVLPALLLGAGVAAVGTMALTRSVVAPVKAPVAGLSIPPAPPAPTERQPEAPAEPASGRTTALHTGPGERVRHRLARGVDAELFARTALVAGDDQAPPEVRVGRVRFSVPAQAPGRRYSVRAGSYEVVVVGTVFDVAVDDRGVSVDVQNGVVQVNDASSGRRLAQLTARGRWSSSVQPAASSPGARAASHALARVPVRRPSTRRLARAVADADQARSLDEAGQIRRRDPLRALDIYRRLAQGSGPMAEVAHYEMGVIEDEDLGQPRQAVATWDRYRTRYPRGLLRTEADLSLIAALARVGDQSRALDEALAFLGQNPGNERRAEIARVAGDLARQGGNCSRAVSLYEQALAARPGREDADDATFHRGACLVAMADGRGLPALRGYLSRFPLGRHALQAQRLLNGGTSGADSPGSRAPRP